MAKYTGDIPQNVNFAIKASLVGDMLDVKDIDYQTAASDKELKTVDIFDRAKQFAVLVGCLKKAILVHEQGQSPDSLKRSYENAPLGQKWFKFAVS